LLVYVSGSTKEIYTLETKVDEEKPTAVFAGPVKYEEEACQASHRRDLSSPL